MKLTLFPKQEQFITANNRINVYVGGIQSGKTTSGGIKMLEAICTYRSPDDNFIICADTYKTLSQATIPKFERLTRGLGRTKGAMSEFKTIWGSTVYLRTSTDPESIEGITNVRRIWVDEAGKVSRYFFENVMGRAAFLEAPVDLTTTPYAMNWLSELVKHQKEGKRDDVHFTHCKSIDSPYFPKAEYERQKGLLDPRRFDMKYNGEFGVMEGLVYDQLPLIRSFPMPAGTRYVAGIDWGYRPDPFVIVFRALTPDGLQYRVGEFYKTHLTISDVVNVVRSYHALYHFGAVYCDPSRPSEIEELNRHGIPAIAAENDLRMGIDAHYALIKAEKFFIFEETNPYGVDEYRTYHYPEVEDLQLDESRSKKDTLPVDSNNHGCDADRYVSVSIKHTGDLKLVPNIPQVLGTDQRPQGVAERIEWLKRRNRIKLVA